MAIQFEVEDGTCKADATSYVSVAELVQYWENRGVDYSFTAGATVQAKLNIATQYVDNLHVYEGQKSTTAQALQFPRSWLVDRNGIDQSSVVPTAVKYAVCEAAAYELEGNSLEAATLMIEARRMGPVSVTYGSRGQLPPRIGKAEKYLGDLVAQMRVTR
jgi:hypothetical protein